MADDLDRRAEYDEDLTEEPVDEADAASELEAEPVQEPERAFRPNWGLALLILALVTLAVGLLLNNVGLLPEPVLLWWPLAVLFPALVWALVSLVSRRPRALLASTAILGIGLSLFLAAQNVAPPGTTLVGFIFIAVGAGLLLRGLLLRGRPA